MPKHTRSVMFYKMYNTSDAKERTV